MGFELQENRNHRAQVSFTALQNTIEAVQLRSRGYPIAEIAAKLNVSPTTVQSYLKEALKRIVGQDIEEMRGLEASRLDQMQSAIWDKATSGDLRAIASALAISKRRSELLGLDKKNDKEELDNGPRALVIEAYKPESIAGTAKDGAVPPSGEGVELNP